MPPTSDINDHAAGEGDQRDESERGNARAVLALAFGIASLPAALCVGFGFLFALPAVILGRSALRTPKGNLARTGMYTGLVGMAVSLISVLLVLFLVVSGDGPDANGGNGKTPDDAPPAPFEALPGADPGRPDDERVPLGPSGEAPF